jgi:hypothetical protein
MQRHVPNQTFSGNRARTLAGASFLIVAFAAYCGAAKAQAPAATLPSTGTIAVPTYEAAGLYWQNPGGSNGCEVKFRKAGEASWSQGLPLWYDARDSQCRGSLVSLSPNTYYQVEFNLPGQAATHGLVFKTWSNQLPVAKTIAVNGGSATLNVAEGGSASTGYVVYEGNGATLDGQNSAQYNVTINASYVIVRGLNLKGAKQDAIRISPNVTDVVIEDNDISGWGRQRSGNWGVDMDSAIRAVCTQPTLMRVTIQRNKMHDPRYSANSWSDGHPAGPQAISFSHCGGNHVFRHNEAYSTNGNYFNDIFGGEDNFTKAGFPNSDTDIYGNRLSHAWDDAIEAEGANENVRIWGNYIDRTAIGVATTATSVGPVYIFRNVWNRAQMYEKTALDADDRQPFFKSGGTSELGHGRRYIFHNTMLQARQSGLSYGLGGGFGLGGTGSAQLIENTWSRNNIYHQWKEGKGFTYQTGSSSSFVSDMYNGTAGDASVTSGIVGTPVYAAGHGWQSEAGGNYQLDSSSPGYGRGTRIPNFNDGAAAPDVGAHQSGTAAMKFGIAASGGSSISAGATTPTDTTTPTPTPTPPPPATTQYALTVIGKGNGTGTVTSSPSAINCGSTCATSFAAGTTVTLTAQPSPGSTFGGWSGACSGTGSCVLSMTADRSATATFKKSSGTPTSGSGVTLSSTALGGFSTTRTQTVTYTNNTGSRVTFIQASMSSARYGQTNNCGEVAPGGSCTATVTYYPTNSGSDTGTFTVTSTAPNSPHVVSLSTGTLSSSSTGSSGVSMSATQLNFSAGASTQTVTYTNNTGVKVTFIQASMSSTRFGQANNCGEVAPGGSCTATVTYYPTNSGSDTGTFTMTSTAPDSPHVVSLNAGTVVQASTSTTTNPLARGDEVNFNFPGRGAR